MWTQKKTKFIFQLRKRSKTNIFTPKQIFLRECLKQMASGLQITTHARKSFIFPLSTIFSLSQGREREKKERDKEKHNKVLNGFTVNLSLSFSLSRFNLGERRKGNFGALGEIISSMWESEVLMTTGKMDGRKEKTLFYFQR